MSCARTSVGIALTEEDIRYCSELISKIIAEEVEEILTAFELIGEAASIAFNIGLQGCVEACEALQAAFREIEEATTAENSGIPPKKYGMSQRKRPYNSVCHYHYIPRAPRNLPYMRRAY